MMGREILNGEGSCGDELVAMKDTLFILSTLLACNH